MFFRSLSVLSRHKFILVDKIAVMYVIHTCVEVIDVVGKGDKFLNVNVLPTCRLDLNLG